MKETTTHHVSALLNQYAWWQGKSDNVLAGLVDMTIYGTYIGDKISDEARLTLKDIALRYVATEMMAIRCDLRDLGVTFHDGGDTVDELCNLLCALYGQKIADAAEAKAKGG